MGMSFVVLELRTQQDVAGWFCTDSHDSPDGTATRFVRRTGGILGEKTSKAEKYVHDVTNDKY